MNVKKSLVYLTYTLSLLILLASVSKAHAYFEQMMSETFGSSWIIYILILYIPVGIYLGLPRLIIAFNQSGKWKINVHKLVLTGFPLLYLTFYPLYPYSHQPPFNQLPSFMFYLVADLRYSIITSIITGFVLVDSFHKKSEPSECEKAR
ncbi:MAG: hypothetical protein H0Z33_08495 [Bacillaceae bacterium]|nr:hypothetical protein [Bacillaceae bacterium]